MHRKDLQWETTQIKVTVHSDDGQTADVPFTLEVIPTQFAITSGIPSFTAINGSAIPAETVSFELDSKATSPWLATSSTVWMNASPLSGTTPAVVTLQPEPNKGNLASGTHTSDLVLSSTGIANKTITTSLDLIKPTLSAPNISVTLGGAKGRDLISEQTILASLNTGATSWPWTMSALPSWLSSSTPTGTVNQAGSNVAFRPVVTNVTPGSVSSTASITASVNGDSVSLPITVNLNADQRRLLVSEWGIGFASTPIGNVLSRTITVSDNFGGALNWNATSDSAWLSVTSNGTTGSASSITLTANPASLPMDAMSYANVTVSTGTPSVGSAVIRIGMWKGATVLASLTEVPLTMSGVIDKIRPYVYSKNATSIDIYNVYTAQKINTIANVGGILGEMTISPDGSRLYVMDAASQSMAVVDLTTLTKIANWPLVKAVDSLNMIPLIAIRPNGVEVVLAGDGTAYEEGRSQGATGMTSNAIFGMGRFAATNDGNTLYYSDILSSLSVYSVDYSAMSGGVLMVRKLATKNISVINIAISGGGNRLYVDGCGELDPISLSAVGGSLIAFASSPSVMNNGRVICGSNFYVPYADDLWVFSPNNTLFRSYRIIPTNSGRTVTQSVVTPDGLVALVFSKDQAYYPNTYVTFVQIGL